MELITSGAMPFIPLYIIILGSMVIKVFLLIMIKFKKNQLTEDK